MKRVLLVLNEIIDDTLRTAHGHCWLLLQALKLLFHSTTHSQVLGSGSVPRGQALILLQVFGFAVSAL